jgi:hypothetical protein
MIFEIHYLVVFRSASDPAAALAALAALVRQAYEEEGESPDSDYLNARLVIRAAHKREDDGQVIVCFTFSDEREETEALSLSATFSGLLSTDPGIEHILKFKDSFQRETYRRYAGELYDLEMRLREAISFIFIDTYGDGYYDLLRDSAAKVASAKEMPTEESFKAHHENQLFYMVFDQYIKVNERKQITSVPDLIDLMGRFPDLAVLQRAVSSNPVSKESYSEFLARIKGWISKVEPLRNCVAHHRTHGRDVPANYEEAKALLHEAIDEFFEKLQAPAEPPPPAGAPPADPAPAEPAPAEPPPINPPDAKPEET